MLLLRQPDDQQRHYQTAFLQRAPVAMQQQRNVALDAQAASNAYRAGFREFLKALCCPLAVDVLKRRGGSSINLTPWL